MKEKYLMNIPRELKEYLQEKAKLKGYSLNSLILKILWETKENEEINKTKGEYYEFRD